MLMLAIILGNGVGKLPRGAPNGQVLQCLVKFPLHAMFDGIENGVDRHLSHTSRPGAFSEDASPD